MIPVTARHRRGRLAAGAAAAAFIAAAAWLAAAPPTPPASALAPLQGANSDTRGAGAPSLKTAPAASPFRTGLEHLPASLDGTEVNDSLRVDAGGHLVVDYAVRALFDYFLTTVGEEPLDTVAARLRAYLGNRLQEPARGEALALLDNYLAFWQAAGELSRTAGQATDRASPAAMANYLAQLRELRSRAFDPAVDRAFFAEQDAYSDYALARQRVLQDASLSAVQRAQQLGALLQQLPAGDQEAVRTATVIQTLDGMTDACRKSGCSADELQQIRTGLVGADAAQRLAALDREEAALQARLASYFVQRDRIASNPAYSEADRQAQVAALQQQLFDDGERQRLVALERIHDGTTTPAVN